MKILLLTASLPYPPTSGGALRVSSLIRALNRLGHQVRLLAYGESLAEWKGSPLAPLCTDVSVVPAPERGRSERLRTLFFSRRADVERRLYSPEMLDTFRELLARETFDLIQAEGIEMAWLLPHAKQIRPATALCFDTFNAEYRLQRVIASIDAREPRRWPTAVYSWLQSMRIARFERDIGSLSDIVIAVSPEDAAALGKLVPGKRIHVVPSAIAVEDYAGEAPKSLGPSALVFTGKMDYRPNVDAAVWFSKSILPLIRLKHREAVLYIVGQKPHVRLEALRNRADVVLTGYVPSVVPYLRGAAVYVAPLRMGSGTRLKLLEAMAAGCAIVATPVAATGLLPEARSAMRLATGAEAFAEAVSTLLSDTQERRARGEQARAAVSATYDWSAVAGLLQRVYEEAGLG